MVLLHMFVSVVFAEVDGLMMFALEVKNLQNKNKAEI